MSAVTCIGGPWDGKKILAPVSGSTMVFRVGDFLGKYVGSVWVTV